MVDVHLTCWLIAIIFHLSNAQSSAPTTSVVSRNTVVNKTNPLCINISSLDSIVFYKGQTVSRQHSSTQPMLAMQCVGVCYYVNMPVVRCVMNNNTQEWQCDANIISPSNIQLGSVHVQCEGCSGPEDILMITNGSCQLQYSLIRTTASTTSTLSSSSTGQVFLSIMKFTGMFLFCCVTILFGGTSHHHHHSSFSSSSHLIIRTGL
eukprot:PhF_6_TR5990/c0_g1_i2/m.8645